jgi:hypothetical protein
MADIQNFTSYLIDRLKLAAEETWNVLALTPHLNTHHIKTRSKQMSTTIVHSNQNVALFVLGGFPGKVRFLLNQIPLELYLVKAVVDLKLVFHPVVNILYPRT